MGVDQALEARTGEMTDEIEAIGAGDQGMMFGFAQMKHMSICHYQYHLAHKLSRRLSEVRKNGNGLLTSGWKTQVTVE